ncbi:MAG: type II secretion system protein GspD [Cytophaga sp.]|uniref:type II secretion system protein GspD n=1 Tax=Cytophaga sp. TaxID=29535 RepID=UPI003F7F4F77
MLRNFLIPILLCFICTFVHAQTESARIDSLEAKLNKIAKAGAPGLNDQIDFSVSGVSIQEFLRGIAEAHELNINIDPQLNFKVYNNFSKETVLNVVLFLAREYDLDIRFTGSIMSFYQYVPLVEKPAYVAKELNIRYSGYSNLLSVDLKNDSLVAVVKKITQITKKNVILSAGLDNKMVSVYIEEMPFEAAVSKMAYANNLKVIKTDDNFYVIKNINEGENTLTDANNTGFKPSYGLENNNAGFQNNNSGYNSGYQQAAAQPSSIRCFVDDSAGFKKIHLEAINAPISEVLKTVAAKAGLKYFMYSDIKGNCTSFVTNATYSELLTFLLQSTEYTFKEENGLYLIGDRKIEGLRTHKVLQLRYRSLDNIQDVIPAELKKGVEIKEFKELNSILLSGSLPQINEIEAFINSIDKIVPMVLIEVIIMEVNKSRTVKTGITAGLKDSVVTGGTFLPGLDLTLSSKTINNFLSTIGANNAINIGQVTPDFYMTLSALEQNANIEVKSTPKLSTLNGHDATMSIGRTSYYYVETQNTIGSLTTNTIKTVQWNSVQANQTITIKPLVSGDDQVTLNIDVNMTDFLPASQQSNTSNSPPNTSTSQFKSIVRVKNEEMIVLGGLEKIQKSHESSGVPVLSRIPVLKWLFSSRTKTKSKSVTVIFIKPTIIY